MPKPVLYIDLDGVVANYGAADHSTRHRAGFFLGLAPIAGAVAAVTRLSERYDVYFLSTAPWSNVHAWSEKRQWLEDHFGEVAFKRLILSHNKGLLRGDFLVDDRIANGVENFQGVHLHFATEEFPDWDAVEHRLA